MKSTRGWGLLPWLVAAFSMLALRPGLLFADEGTTMALSLNAGESYVINNVSPGETPAVSVITNPHALVVHNEEPGKVVLLGAEAGEWTVAVKTTDGSTVKYDVTVKSVANVNDINHPGKRSRTNHGHRRDHWYSGSGSGQDGSGHRSGCIGVVAGLGFFIGVGFFVKLYDHDGYDGGDFAQHSSAGARSSDSSGSDQSLELRFCSFGSGRFLCSSSGGIRVRPLRRRCRMSGIGSIRPSA